MASQEDRVKALAHLVVLMRAAQNITFERRGRTPGGDVPPGSGPILTIEWRSLFITTGWFPMAHLEESPLTHIGGAVRKALGIPE